MPRVWKYVVLGLLLSFALRAESFFCGPGIDPDEGLSLLQGRALCEGYLPYVKYFDHRQPLLYVNFAIAQTLFGERVLSCRIWAAMCVGVAATCVGLIARRMTGSTAGAVAAMALLCIHSTNTHGLAAISELLLMPWTTLAVLLALNASDAAGSVGRRRALLAFAGLALGVGAQVKLLAGFELPAVLLAGFLSPQSRRGLKAAISDLAFLGAAAAVPTVGVALTYWIAGHWQTFVYACFTYNKLYAASAEWSSAFAWVFVKDVSIGMVALLPLTLLGVTRVSAQRSAVVLGGVWFVVTLIAACSTKRFFPHYSLALLPGMCLLAGVAVAELGRLPRWPRRGMVAVATISLLLLASQVRQRITDTRSQRQTWLNVEAATKQLASPGDVTFFANVDPALYYTTRTEPATRWAFPQWLGHPEWTTVSKVDWQAELRKVAAARPRVIVLKKVGGGWHRKTISYFQRRLADRYRVVRDTPRHILYVPAKNKPTKKRQPTTTPATHPTSPAG